MYMFLFFCESLWWNITKLRGHIIDFSVIELGNDEIERISSWDCIWVGKSLTICGFPRCFEVARPKNAYAQDQWEDSTKSWRVLARRYLIEEEKEGERFGSNSA